MAAVNAIGCSSHRRHRRQSRRGARFLGVVSWPPRDVADDPESALSRRNHRHSRGQDRWRVHRSSRRRDPRTARLSASPIGARTRRPPPIPAMSISASASRTLTRRGDARSNAARRRCAAKVRSTVDDGPNKGARVAYLRIHDGVTLEVYQGAVVRGRPADDPPREFPQAQSRPHDRRVLRALDGEPRRACHPTSGLAGMALHPRRSFCARRRPGTGSASNGSTASPTVDRAFATEPLRTALFADREQCIGEFAGLLSSRRSGRIHAARWGTTAMTLEHRLGPRGKARHGDRRRRRHRPRGRAGVRRRRARASRSSISILREGGVGR